MIITEFSQEDYPKNYYNQIHKIKIIKILKTKYLIKTKNNKINNNKKCYVLK